MILTEQSRTAVDSDGVNRVRLLDPVQQFKPSTMSRTFSELYEKLKRREQTYEFDTNTDLRC